MIASLPMYPMFRAEVEALWRAIAASLRALGVADVPPSLVWPDDLLAHARRPDLLLSQTCGYPLVTKLSDMVRVVGAFHYAAPGCDGLRYRSRVIARADDPKTDIAAFRGRRVAYNGRDSQSGYNALRALIAPLAQEGRFFGSALETGAHYASMQAVADGRADIAAIDCVSFAHIGAADPDLAQRLKVVGETPSAPALPLITRGTATDKDVATLRKALSNTIRDPTLAGVRERLMIAGFEPVEFAAYAEITTMEATAIAAGYPALN
jgi:ABC-type phosphate/phosphonate transport system substrate-binding protein